MTTSQAFKLAVELNYFYYRKLTHSNKINEILKKELGKVLYQKFCKEIKNYFQPVMGSPFKKEFEAKELLNDMQVYTFYSLEKIFQTLSTITS